MERYYVPADFSITDDSLFSVRWVGSDYYVFDGCPNRTSPDSLDFIKVSPWGFTLDVGTSTIPIDSKLLVGEECTEDTNNIATVALSRSILDAPNFSPYEPFYFLGFFTLSFFLILFSLKTLFGRGYR